MNAKKPPLRAAIETGADGPLSRKVEKEETDYD